MFVRQREEKDCGVAALAMLCDVTYDEAIRAIPWRRVGLLDGTSTKMLVAGAAKLGYEPEASPGRLPYRLRVLPDKSWTNIPNNSLVKIPHPSGPEFGWHWVVWRKKKIYDPARGVFRPANYDHQLSSYMEFRKCES